MSSLSVAGAAVPSPARPGGRPRVVVVGAGFGGLAAVRGLRDAPVDVLLVDAHNYHLFQPLLYQVGTALLDPSEIAYPTRTILRRQGNADFLLARVEGVDIEARRLATDAGPVDFDWLVLATGAVTETLGKTGVEANAFALKTLGDALALRNHILATIERAAATTDPEERRRLLTVAVVGGGATGVELCGAIGELVSLVLQRDYPHLDLGSLRIVLLEAGGDLLTAFAPLLRRNAAVTLRRRGVEVRSHATVDDVDSRGLLLPGGERLDAGTVIWTVGVRGAPTGGLLAEHRDGQGRIPVDAAMRIVGAERAFVIGDLARREAKGAPLPMLAPVAMQQGTWVARHITASLSASAAPPPFRYIDKGTMATIGRNAAVAQIGPLRLWGRVGWLLWLGLHLAMLISFRNRAVVLINWARDYLFYDRPVRLITGPHPPPGGGERG